MSASPSPWPVRHRLLIQLAAIALALGFWAYKMAQTWPTLPAPTVRGPGITSAEFPLERFTRRDLEAYAPGERSDGRLLDVFDQEVHDAAIGIEAALISPAGYHQDGTSSYGWPYAVYSWRKSASYSDVYALNDPSTASTGLVDTWTGWAHVRVRIDEAGRRERSAFTPERLVGSLIVIFAAWFTVRLFFIALMRVRPESQRVARLRRVVPLLIAAGATGAVALLCLRPVTTNKPWKAPATMPTTAPTGLTIGDIASLQSDPVGEAKLARALLSAADAAEAASPATEADTSSDEPVLVYAWRQDRQMEYAHAGGGWPHGVNVVRIRVASAEEAPRSFSWKYHCAVDRYALRVARVNTADPAERTTAHYSFAALAKVTFALLLIWYTIAGALAVWRRLLRRRDRRRARAGRCIACGYDLRGV